MAESYVLAEQDYMAGMKYKEIAEKYGVSLNTVKSWKQRYGWDRKKGAHKQKSVRTKKGGAPPGNQYAKGNRGGAAPKGNKNAEKHGFFSKYLPAESLEIMEQLQTRSPLDIVWDNIMIQYTAIIRAQQIMYVRDRDDKTVEKIEEKDGNVIGERWEVQQAWDKQANFLQAQSRAMTTLQGLIKQYDELLKTELATEEQKARIEVLKAKVPNKDGIDPNAQITALADLINNPAPARVIDDD
ncbi:phage terminase small subunit [Paenibacillus sp. USDA918EY]|uniref:phage terminase small subunit n=1 Tax=Paenibacillus sp. USDA918EY TaxID=2689575 RepID=UPI00135A66DE|nr:phage terminase small subunit [Paenibacillus sp. USDA918EY]